MRFRVRWIEDRWPVWAAVILRFVTRLIQTRIFGFERTKDFGNYAAAHWHGDELALIPHFGHLGIVTLISNSTDGENMAKGASFFGYQVRRGSSNGCAAAGLRSLVKAITQGHSGVLAVDGSRGPRGICKPGIVRLAQKKGLPLFPVGVATSLKFVFEKSWNKTYLPLPFARQVIIIGEPLFFEKSTPKTKLDSHCRSVETALQQAHDKAQKRLHLWSES